ncbi:MAG: zinc ABC transporter ATP-binding protein ZnuC [Chromatiaceae bacterium]|jgi:zinc transport system ATP-binding protein|nr:zinc ABC transporter ATP-binding protein ZnuC [Chromatiaceae bacterium]
MKAEQLIVGRDLGVSVNGRQLIRHIDLEVSRRRILTVIGPNGAGKTTLVRVALGLLQPTQGKIERAPGLRIGYMPQRLHVPESMPLTVLRFLSLTHPDPDRLQDSARLVSVSHLLDRPIQGLSGGETQRVLLARALLGDPDLLVLDEPVQGIDVNGQSELYRLIVRLRDERGCAVMMVSHDLHLVMAATDEVLCINQHVCCSGHPDAVSKHPAYLDLFGAIDAKTLAVYTHRHDHRHDMHGDVIRAAREHDHG